MIRVSSTFDNNTIRPTGGLVAATRSPWYRRVLMPDTVEDAKPPRPFVSSHSRLAEAFRSRQTVSSNRIMRASQLRDFAEYFDGAVWMRQLVEQQGIVFQTLYGIGQQPRQPSRIFGLGLRHVANSRFKVLAAGIHRADHHFVAENEFQV